MGIFTGIAIVMLYMILVYRGFKIALKQKDVFYRILAIGISLLLGIQTFIIIGGVIKLIPLTGLTLPFVSYGGTSILSSFIALGILQGASEKGIYGGSNDE
jgi:cell division protein FtsW (lipid II flippase)